MISLKQLEKLAIDNSPALLTAIGVVGTIGTAVLTHKAASRVRDMEDETQEIATGKEHFKRVWKFYIPPVVSGTITVSAIVMANHIGTKRAAAVAAAYTISEKAYSEYKDKVIERIGANEEQKVRDDIVKDRVRNNPQDESNMVVIGSGEVLCYEKTNDRYFNSSVDQIKRAMNEVNHQINSHGYASLSDFYQQLGIRTTSVSDELGWTGDFLMDIDFTTVMSEDGRPCVAIDYRVQPVRDYHRFH